MADNTWFEGPNSPGAGDLGQIQALQENLASVASAAQNAQTGLSRIRDQVSDAVWRGSAAESFKSKIDGGFLGDLGKLHASYQDAADGFDAYISAVSDIAGRAQNLGTQIVTAQQRYESATSALQAWLAANPTVGSNPTGSITAPPLGQGGPYHVDYQPAPTPLPGSPLPGMLATPAPATSPGPVTTAAPSYQSLQHAVDDAWQAMQGLYRQMDQLKTHDRANADNAVTAKLSHAQSVGMHNESFWHKFFHWVSTIAKWAGLVLLVVAIVALIVLVPELGLAAAFAYITSVGSTLGAVLVFGGAAVSAVKLGADIGQDVTGGGASWQSIAGDVVGLVPLAGPAGRAFSGLGAPASRLVEALGGGIDTAKVFSAFKVTSLFNRAGGLFDGLQLAGGVKAEQLFGRAPRLFETFPALSGTGEKAGQGILNYGTNQPVTGKLGMLTWAGKGGYKVWSDRSLVPGPAGASSPDISQVQADAQIRQFDQSNPAQAAQANQIAANLAQGHSAHLSYPPQHTYPQAVAVAH